MIWKLNTTLHFSEQEISIVPEQAGLSCLVNGRLRRNLERLQSGDTARFHRQVGFAAILHLAAAGRLKARTLRACGTIWTLEVLLRSFEHVTKRAEEGGDAECAL
jgi:hypothetical protein